VHQFLCMRPISCSLPNTCSFPRASLAGLVGGETAATMASYHAISCTVLAASVESSGLPQMVANTLGALVQLAAGK
jgi:hypothetical protein